MFNKKFIINEIAKLRKALGERMDKHATEIAELSQNSKQYCECSVCGHLVNKEKAKVEWELKQKHEQIGTLTPFGVFMQTDEKEAVKTYKCLSCQTKKSNKK